MGRPKALVPAPGGGTFLERVVASCRGAGCAPVLVVVGAEGDAVAAEARRVGASVVENGAWRRGRTSSLQAALPWLPAGARGLLLHPVDHPLVAAATGAALVAAFVGAPSPTSAVVPVHGGRRGHPVILAASLFPAVAALGPDAPLRSLLRAAGPAVVEVPVDDAGVLRNLDAPGDLR